jgi:hypothetical protein
MYKKCMGAATASAKLNRMEKDSQIEFISSQTLCSSVCVCVKFRKESEGGKLKLKTDRGFEVVTLSWRPFAGDTSERSSKPWDVFFFGANTRVK